MGVFYKEVSPNITKNRHPCPAAKLSKRWILMGTQSIHKANVNIGSVNCVHCKSLILIFPPLKKSNSLEVWNSHHLTPFLALSQAIWEDLTGSLGTRSIYQIPFQQSQLLTRRSEGGKTLKEFKRLIVPGLIRSWVCCINLLESISDIESIAPPRGDPWVVS